MASASAPSAQPTIFISYRRGDTGGFARSIFERLQNWFGPGRVFFDLDHIEVGDDFPSELDSAIRSARVTVAVIGPDWLRTLKERAERSPDKVDVVREELRLSLDLKLMQPGRSVIAVLVGDASMFDEASLPESTRSELAALAKVDALELRGKQVQWDFSLRMLQRKLGALAEMRPVPTIDDAVRMAAAASDVQAQLTDPSMAFLRQHWGEEPLRDRHLVHVEDVLLAYAKSVEKARIDWRRQQLSPEDAAEIRGKCRTILAVIYSLAVDGEAARAYVEGPSDGRPVPVATASALTFAYAVVNGKRVSIAPAPLSEIEFLPEGTVDLGYVDSGVGQQRRAQVHKTFWTETFSNPLKPYPKGDQPLEDESLRALRLRMAQKAKVEDRSHMITEIAPSFSGAVSDLQFLADELQVLGVARTGKSGDTGFLHVDEESFNSQIVDCLERIEKIK